MADWDTPSARLTCWDKGTGDPYFGDLRSLAEDVREVLEERAELLAELIAMTERFKRCCLHAGNSEETAELACASARAVIAKAGGV